MLGLLVSHLVAAVVAPLLVRWWGPRAFTLLAVVPATTFGWALTQAEAVRDGGAVVQVYPWVSQLDLELALRMTTLSWLMVLLVSGVGALALAYCAQYFHPRYLGAQYATTGEPSLGRFAGVFVAFAGAMLGLVLADDLILLYIFWELTTVFSYLLIGHKTTSRTSRRAAIQALLVTTLGGLAMLIGLIMLGEHAGDYRWSVVVQAPPDGTYLAVAVVLVLVGAMTKSAIFPFGFWLPAAMAAPTPVSAYLHAAAMVKAGVFLVALMAPEFADDAPWRAVVLVGGLVTMLIGGWTALRQNDIKLLLAYGTVSQLGLLVVLLGAGTRDAALAGVALLLAHALFKATLFLVVGVVDRTTGTRDLRRLTGLWRREPALAVVAALAVASMVGFPPLLGFVGKEAMLTAFLGGGLVDSAVLVGLVAGSVLTVAYGLRFLWGAFADKPGMTVRAARPLVWEFLAPAALLSAAGLVTGLAAHALDAPLASYADSYPTPAEGYHLALWHGATPALGLSALVLALGVAVFAGSNRPGWQRLRLPFDGGTAYERVMTGVDRAAVELTGATQRGSLPFYLVVILLVLVGLAGGALLSGQVLPARVRLWSTSLQLVPAAVLIAAAFFAARTQRRLTGVILVGVTGYATAALFILHGAPDLALTQFLVETCTLVMFVLVLRRLPARFSERPLVASRWGRVTVGVAVGVVVAGMAAAAVGSREATSISTDFPEVAVSYGGGHNVVNVTLVDIRAWDTMGEISVLVVAATGVVSLVFLNAPPLRRRRLGRSSSLRPPRGGRQIWLMAGHTLDAGLRSPILEVITRLLFHTIVLFSVYLLFSGHNAPGGGFAGGLVAGLALALRYLAAGRDELNVAAPVDAGLVLGTGLFVAVGTGVAAMLFGGKVLQSALLDFHLPLLGDVHMVTSMVFDVGVYLVVVGLVLSILRSLGAEIDRREEPDTQASESDAHAERELV